MNYYIWISGTEYGPYSLQQINDAVNDGTISPQQTARTEESSDWKPLSQIARLVLPKPAEPAAKPPTAPPPIPSAPSAIQKSKDEVAWGTKDHSGAITTGLVGLVILGFLAWKLAAIERLLDKKETPPQFEYMVVAPKDYSFTSEMNLLGAAGWEVVTARRATSGSEYDRSASYEIIL